MSRNLSRILIAVLEEFVERCQRLQNFFNNCHVENQKILSNVSNLFASEFITTNKGNNNESGLTNSCLSFATNEITNETTMTMKLLPINWHNFQRIANANKIVEQLITTIVTAMHQITRELLNSLMNERIEVRIDQQFKHIMNNVLINKLCSVTKLSKSLFSSFVTKLQSMLLKDYSTSQTIVMIIDELFVLFQHFVDQEIHKLNSGNNSNNSDLFFELFSVESFAWIETERNRERQLLFSFNNNNNNNNNNNEQQKQEEEHQQEQQFVASRSLLLSDVVKHGKRKADNQLIQSNQKIDIEKRARLTTTTTTTTNKQKDNNTNNNVATLKSPLKSNEEQLKTIENARRLLDEIKQEKKTSSKSMLNLHKYVHHF